MIAAIVLAAGVSKRMGAFKPLLPIAGKPMVVRVLDSLSAAVALESIVVVTGHEASRLCEALRGFPVSCVHNADYASGEMLSSVQTGLRALPRKVSAFVLAFADQPEVKPETIRKLVSAWQIKKPPLAIPTFNGKRGHPILISMLLREEILALPAGATLKNVTHRHRDSAAQIVVDDPAVLLDIDTPDEYAKIQSAGDLR